MPRGKAPPRLWLRPADGERAPVWVIKDGDHRESTGCGADAAAEAERRLGEYLARKHDPGSQGQRRGAHEVPVADVLSVYLDEEVPKQARPLVVTARIARLFEWWGDKMLSEVTPATCREYAETRKRGGARRDLEDLRSAINYHARRELHTGVIQIDLPAKGKPRSKFLTRQEAARLLWYCWRHKRVQRPPRGARKGKLVESKSYYDLRHIARFILMGLYTGSRSGPILKASVYAAAGRAFLDIETGLFYRLPEDMEEAANKKSPVVRIPTNLLDHLRRWKARGAIAQFVVEWEGLPVKSIKVGWKTAVAGAKLAGRVTPHTLRHTCVTWLLQQGVPTWEVAGYVGMSEHMVREVYGHHHPDFQKGAAGALKRRR